MSQPCNDCGSNLSRDQHICLPCLDQADVDESQEICGDIDQRTGKIIIYFINSTMAEKLDAATADIGSVLDYIEGIE